MGQLYHTMFILLNEHIVDLVAHRNSLLKNAENSSELFKIGKGGEPLQQQIAHEQQAAESKCKLCK